MYRAEDELQTDQDLLRGFSPSYGVARQRFREAAQQAGFALSSYPLEACGPDGQQLTIDVARKGASSPDSVLVISSGTHGVEGFFGSAVQCAALNGILPSVGLPAHAAVVLVHAVNPHGFAWLRRVNEDNVDLNRNFVVAGGFQGAPAGYDRLNPLLNPCGPPTQLETFWLQAAAEVALSGFRSVKNAIAQGQYEYPKGLFFGGYRPTASHLLLSKHAPAWLGSPRRVLHIDLHTGMGKRGSYALCVDLPAESVRVAQLKREFGQTPVQGFDPRGVLYQIRGALGPWLQSRFPQTQYDCLLAEVGTYPAMDVLAALRDENRAHFYAQDSELALRRCKQRLLEVFCPRSPSWRKTAGRTALKIIGHGLEAVAGQTERRSELPSALLS